MDIVNEMLCFALFRGKEEEEKEQSYRIHLSLRAWTNKAKIIVSLLPLTNCAMVYFFFLFSCS